MRAETYRLGPEHTLAAPLWRSPVAHLMIVSSPTPRTCVASPLRAFALLTAPPRLGAVLPVSARGSMSSLLVRRS